jgi:Mrp family chromosome partitioning ATPase
VVLRSLADSFDYVVVDTAPVLPVADVSVMASALDGYLLVARYGRTRRGQVADAVGTLRSTGTAVLGSVLNVTPGKGEGEYYGYGYATRQKAPRRRHPRPSRRPRRRERELMAPIRGFPTPDRTRPVGGDPLRQTTAKGNERPERISPVGNHGAGESQWPY